MMVAVLVLLGVMVGRRDPDLSNAVRHLFVRVDSERTPMLPAQYRGVAPYATIVLGDAWAAGFGVDSTADDSWWAQLHARELPQTVMLRSTNATARVADIATLATRLALPPTLQGRTVALIVQCGWNDIVTADPLDALDIRLLAARLVSGVNAVVAQSAFQRAASLSVYVVDYADVSAGTGFTELVCEAPLNTVYNHAAAASVHLRALDMYSQALMGAATGAGFAFVPLRTVLAGIGSAQATHSIARARHTPVGVGGTPLCPVPPAFSNHCGLMNADGQHYQADLIAAHILNKPYFIAG